jgi:hypothetical protein
MEIKFHVFVGIDLAPSCLPGERFDRYVTEVRTFWDQIERIKFISH